MTAEKLQGYCRATPFQPFKVHLANGRQIEIQHPDYTFVTASGRYFVHFRDDDSHEMVDILLINSVETFPPAGRAHAEPTTGQRP